MTKSMEKGSFLERRFAEAVRKAAADRGTDYAATDVHRYLTGFVLHAWCARSWADRKAFAADVIEDKLGS